MNQLNLFIELTRLKKPIGFMLLFWPCMWSLLLYSLYIDQPVPISFFVLFFIGSIIMRGAGCTWNDFLDKEYDKNVSRTKDRPCLLYTSPSPRDATLSRMPSSA